MNEAPVMSKTGLHQISGFWRNDQPRGKGLGIMLRGTPEELAGLRDVIMTYDEPDDKDTNARLLAQLEALATLFVKRTFKQDMIALMVINLLENRGVIQPDEYNGMQWMWIKDRVLYVSNEAM